MRMHRMAIFLAALAFAAGARAAELRVSDAWIRLLPGHLPAAGYFTLHNDSGTAAKLVGARSDAFGDVMMHRTVTEGGNARMEGVDAVALPAHGAVRFAPGGYHLMLMQAKPGLKVGDRVPMVLELEGGRTIESPFEVRGPGGK